MTTPDLPEMFKEVDKALHSVLYICPPKCNCIAEARATLRAIAEAWQRDTTRNMDEERRDILEALNGK